MIQNYYELVEKLAKEAKEISNELNKLQSEIMAINWLNDNKVINCNKNANQEINYNINAYSDINKGF